MSSQPQPWQPTPGPRHPLRPPNPFPCSSLSPHIPFFRRPLILRRTRREAVGRPHPPSRPRVDRDTAHPAGLGGLPRFQGGGCNRRRVRAPADALRDTFGRRSSGASGHSRLASSVSKHVLPECAAAPASLQSGLGVPVAATQPTLSPSSRPPKRHRRHQRGQELPQRWFVWGSFGVDSLRHGPASFGVAARSLWGRSGPAMIGPGRGGGARRHPARCERRCGVWFSAEASAAAVCAVGWRQGCRGRRRRGRRRGCPEAATLQPPRSSGVATMSVEGRRLRSMRSRAAFRRRRSHGRGSDSDARSLHRAGRGGGGGS